MGSKGRSVGGNFFFFSLFPEREAGHKIGGIEARDDIGIGSKRRDRRSNEEKEREGESGKPKRALGEKGREFRYRRYGRVYLKVT